MPDTAFTELCQAFCSRLGAASPNLQPKDSPVPGLRVVIGGIEVDLLQASVDDANWGLLLVDLGALESGPEVQALLTLLQANFMLMGPCAPVFAVHPVTGSAVIYQPFSVASVTAAKLEAAARELVTLAARWRRGEFIAQPEVRPAKGASSQVADLSHIA